MPPLDLLRWLAMFFHRHERAAWHGRVPPVRFRTPPRRRERCRPAQPRPVHALRDGGFWPPSGFMTVARREDQSRHGQQRQPNPRCSGRLDLVHFGCIFPCSCPIWKRCALRPGNDGWRTSATMKGIRTMTGSCRSVCRRTKFFWKALGVRRHYAETAIGPKAGIRPAASSPRWTGTPASGFISRSGRAGDIVLQSAGQSGAMHQGRRLISNTTPHNIDINFLPSFPPDF